MSLDGIDFYVNIMGINLYFTDDNWKGKGMFLIRTKKHNPLSKRANKGRKCQ